MDRREELERKHRPELFKDCEICETNVRIEGHVHDPEKEKVYWAKVYPAIAPLETQISDILERHIGIPLGDEQIDAITEELSNLFNG